MASPIEFAKTLEVGIDNFAVFVITIIGVLATDLLTGVAIGIAAELIIHLIRGLKFSNIFSIAYHLNQTAPDTYYISISGGAVFSNFIGLKSLLANFPKQKQVFFDLTDIDLIDHTVMEFIHHFKEQYDQTGGYCEILGLYNHHSYSDHYLAARRRLTN